MFVIAGSMKCLCGIKVEASSVLDQDKKDMKCSHVHKDCMRCFTCGKSLANRKWCFLHKGYPYCDIKCLRVKRHPRNSFCHFCEESLTGNSEVIKIRGHVYHPFCLRCSQCGVQLRSGQQYSLNKEKGIVCLKHADKKTEGGKNKQLINRTSITEMQRLGLSYHYTKCKYPNTLMQKEIARHLKLDQVVVKVWFQNNRARKSKACAHAPSEHD